MAHNLRRQREMPAGKAAQAEQTAQIAGARLYATMARSLAPAANASGESGASRTSGANRGGEVVCHNGAQPRTDGKRQRCSQRKRRGRYYLR